MASISTSFEIYNEEAVKNLQENNPDILPQYSVDEGKDTAYNKEQVTNAIASAIIQGQSIPDISSTLQDTIANLNESSATKAARTAITSAQNAGTLSTMEQLAAMGVTVQKEWVATFDDRTRESHAALDGERRDLDEEFSNGLQYPGDPSGDPSEVWNCRCTIVSYIPKYDSKSNDATRWSRNTETGDTEYVSNMTFSEWLSAKQYSDTASETGQIAITNEAIQSVPYVESQALGKKASKALQTRSREVLTEAAKHAIGTEVGMACDLSGKKIWQGVGNIGSVSIPAQSAAYITIHNHPDGQTFSHTDLQSFLRNAEMQGMIVVGNDGSIYSIFKTTDYDGFIAREAFLEKTKLLKKYLDEQNINAYISEMQNFIEGCEEYGCEINR